MSPTRPPTLVSELDHRTTPTICWSVNSCCPSHRTFLELTVTIRHRDRQILLHSVHLLRTHHCLCRINLHVHWIAVVDPGTTFRTPLLKKWLRLAAPPTLTNGVEDWLSGVWQLSSTHVVNGGMAPIVGGTRGSSSESPVVKSNSTASLP